jgi:hypothetical protein
VPGDGLAIPAEPAARSRAARSPETTESQPPPEVSPTSGTLAEELALMDQARQALARDDVPATLAALDSHAQRFPHGALASERDVVRVTALCVAGRDVDARAAAATAGARPAIARALSRCTSP